MEDRKPTAIVREDRTDTLIAVLTFWGMAKAWFLNSDKDETLWQIHLEHTQQNYTQCAILSGIQKFLKSESHEMQEVTDFRSLEEHAHITVLNHVLEAAPDDQHVDTLDFTPGKPVFYVHHRFLEYSTSTTGSSSSFSEYSATRCSTETSARKGSRNCRTYCSTATAPTASASYPRRLHHGRYWSRTRPTPGYKTYSSCRHQEGHATPNAT